MSVYRAQISFPYDSAFPRDVFTITPHYTGTDHNALSAALLANLQTITGVSSTGVFTIKIYDAQKPKPNYPLVTTTHGTGFKTSTLPRELALCLSYYSGRNIPRFRGRLYIPMPMLGGSMNVRPSSTQQTDCLAWGSALGKNLPSNTYFVVYSRKDNQAYPITNLYVDDEWDVVRSRGLRAVTRTAGTLP